LKKLLVLEVVMRKLLFLSILFVLSLSSCFHYEEEVSVISFDQKDYKLSSFLEEDWGHHSANHYNMDFSIVGESTIFEQKQDVAGNVYYVFSEPFDCYLFVEMFSAGPEEFQDGVFRYLGNRKIDEVADDEFVFRRFQFGRSENEKLYAREGYVTVTIDNKGTYHLKFDVDLDTGGHLTGTFIGQPEYLDRRTEY